MLKALELVGFKSFADKTRFEFPRGITAIVGPNGSGKSNVVDAIKWVLGEQSVKSLRGKEMADCIFNGSASRPPLNFAETTLTFDNAERKLACDAPEVAITRRVYRSGESEYLINQQQSRLRDIRDLFSGTGVTTEAYSVIEQGKVDVLLQSSPRDRRLIFEEAAGISRFKAKKVESLRRLERVEQNVLRLSDIVSEVESRLKSVRQQASKARRYQEHATRLQSLRTQVGQADWRKLSNDLARYEEQIAALSVERDQHLATAGNHDAEIANIERALTAIDERVRESQQLSASNLQRIASLEATIAHEHSRSAEAAEEEQRLRRQLASLGTRAGDVRQQLHDTSAEADAADRAHRQIDADVQDRERQLASLATQLEQLRADDERRRAEHLDHLRTAAAIESDINALDSRLAQMRSLVDRHVQRIAEIATAREHIAADVATLRQQQEALARTINQRQAELSRAHARLLELRKGLAGQVADLNQLEQKQSRASERASVLEELENRFEGLDAGVREVILAARHSDDGPLSGVRGLVADLLRVNVEAAALIDIALGEKAQHVVLPHDDDVLQVLDDVAQRFKGRVGFVAVDSTLAAHDTKIVDLSGPGVLGRADRFVEVDAEMAPLCRRLLATTWIVETLADACRLATDAGRGQTFITTAGQRLSSDGAISAGPKTSAGGLISRRSELRALKQLIAELDAQIAATRQECTQFENQIASEDQRIAILTEERAQASAASSELRVEITGLESRATQLDEQRESLDGEIASLRDEQASAQVSLADLAGQREQVLRLIVDAEAAAASTASQLAALSDDRVECERQATLAKVELAKSHERLAGLRARRTQFELEQQERQRTLGESREHLTAARQRHEQSQRAILDAESQLALLYLAKERLLAEARQHAGQRDDHHRARSQHAASAQRLRAAAHAAEESHHATQLQANQVRHERATLAQRLREDYAIELAEQVETESDEQLHEREVVEQEIADLRRKLNQLGNVNLDSLGELDDLESRHATLRAQHEDLDKAKRLLVEVIEKINVDSRTLFADTLEQVRKNFQTLFRKLFGGGQADIVLENEVDVLDCGIEIVARPPGKEPRSISLLSGGEKTLTCVALLLSIFQYRPSPFCVLDEVDAALDEANIERFAGVLEEFLEWTQFIVVTHSKKTMTCASTLYGVTMQESGISKRVAVRFDDISDDGHIRPTAERDDDETQAA